MNVPHMKRIHFYFFSTFGINFKAQLNLIFIAQFQRQINEFFLFFFVSNAHKCLFHAFKRKVQLFKFFEWEIFFKENSFVFNVKFSLTCKRKLNNKVVMNGQCLLLINEWCEREMNKNKCIFFRLPIYFLPVTEVAWFISKN